MRRIREDKIERDATAMERTKWEKELTKQLDILRNDLSARLNQVGRYWKYQKGNNVRKISNFLKLCANGGQIGF